VKTFSRILAGPHTAFSMFFDRALREIKSLPPGSKIGFEITKKNLNEVKTIIETRDYGAQSEILHEILTKPAKLRKWIRDNRATPQAREQSARAAWQIGLIKAALDKGHEIIPLDSNHGYNVQAGLYKNIERRPDGTIAVPKSYVAAYSVLTVLRSKTILRKKLSKKPDLNIIGTSHGFDIEQSGHEIEFGPQTEQLRREYADRFSKLPLDARQRINKIYTEMKEAYRDSIQED